MINIRTWYTYATDVLGYMNPKYKLVLGITRESTCEKLSESPYFLLCPKDTTRHKREIFKSIYHGLYEMKNSIVLPDDYFLIKSYGNIVESYVIHPQQESDTEFLKALGPFSTWTIEHLMNYTVGRNIEQEGVRFGSIAIFVLRVYFLPETIVYHRPAQEHVSNQYFNIELEDDSVFNFENPVVPNEEFNEILSSIKYIYSLYLALKSVK